MFSWDIFKCQKNIARSCIQKSGGGESFENAVFATSHLNAPAAEEHLLNFLEKFVFNLWHCCIDVSPESSNSSTYPFSCSVLPWALVKMFLEFHSAWRGFFVGFLIPPPHPLTFISGLCVHEGGYILSQSELATALKQIQVGWGQNTLEYLND